jgi:hypothetical protein
MMRNLIMSKAIIDCLAISLSLVLDAFVCFVVHNALYSHRMTVLKAVGSHETRERYVVVLNYKSSKVFCADELAPVCSNTSASSKRWVNLLWTPAEKPCTKFSHSHKACGTSSVVCAAAVEVHGAD